MLNIAENQRCVQFRLSTVNGTQSIAGSKMFLNGSPLGSAILMAFLSVQLFCEVIIAHSPTDFLLRLE